MAVILAIDQDQQGRTNTDENWVSGTPASLATSGAATVVFDLGPAWRQTRSLVVAHDL